MRQLLAMRQSAGRRRRLDGRRFRERGRDQEARRDLLGEFGDLRGVGPAIGGREESGDEPLALGQALVPEEVGHLGRSAQVDDPGARGPQAVGLEQAEALAGHVREIGVPTRQGDPMDLVDDERGRLGQVGRQGARREPEEPALLAGQERVAGRDEPGEGGVLRQRLNRALEGRHVVVFPDRHVLVQVADEGVPPADHPAAGPAEQRQAGLLDEPVVGRTLVGPDPNPPLAVDAGSAAARLRVRPARAVVAAQRRDEDGRGQEERQDPSGSRHHRTPPEHGGKEGDRTASYGARRDLANDFLDHDQLGGVRRMTI